MVYFATNISQKLISPVYKMTANIIPLTGEIYQLQMYRQFVIDINNYLNVDESQTGIKSFVFFCKPKKEKK